VSTVAAADMPTSTIASHGAPWLAADVPGVRLRLDQVRLHAGHRASGRVLAHDVSFEVLPGQRWVVLGPNGAGKSTLLAVMAGLARPPVGQVSLDGADLATRAPTVLARRRAWCPSAWSDPFPATVLETVTLAMPDLDGLDPFDGRAPSARPGRGHEAATAATALTTRTTAMAQRAGPPAVQAVLQALDLDALVMADVRGLSGGERQRAAIATALLQGAPLLLLDEPASHLDLLHQQTLLGVLQAHAQAGGSIVASVHDLNLAWDLATHAVLFDGRGEVVVGTRAQVLTEARLRRAFGVPVHRVAVCGQERFWIGPGPAGEGPR
jgi:iron complex transport system ATP-binding protein